MVQYDPELAYCTGCGEPVTGIAVRLNHNDHGDADFCTPLCCVEWLLEKDQIGRCRVCGGLAYLCQWLDDPTVCNSDDCIDKAIKELEK